MAGWLRRASARSLATSSANANGLGQVVVGAPVEPFDAIFDRARGGQHEDPRPDRPGELGAHLVAGHAWQVPVERDHVVVVDLGVLKTGVSVQGGIHRHPFQAQPGGNRVRQLAVVLDHEHPHGGSPCCAGWVSCGQLTAVR